MRVRPHLWVRSSKLAHQIGESEVAFDGRNLGAEACRRAQGKYSKESGDAAQGNGSAVRGWVCRPQN
eukprot:6193573-Pleurochrysis_carterae.AAC.1